MNKIDEVKNYWNNRPCNIRHSKKPFGTKEYFDDVEWRKYFVEPHIPYFAEFSKWKGKKVLEIGCGLGTDTINFARAGAIITAVELSEESLKIARQRAEVFGFPNIRFFAANAEELSKTVPVEPYDLIYSFGVIHHTPHPERAIEEIKKYCTKTTEVRIMLYSKWCWKTFWILMKYGYGQFWKASSLFAKYSEAQIGSPVSYVYSFADVRKLMKGFDVTKIYKDHIFPYVIPKYVKHEYQYVWYFRWMPKALFHWLEKRWGWHTMIIAQLKNENSTHTTHRG